MQVITNPTAIKVIQATRPYFLSGLYYAGMVSWFGYAASKNTLKADGAIIVLLTVSLAAFVFNVIMNRTYVPKRNSWFLNGCALTVLYNPLTLSIPYQLLTTMLSIGDRALNHSSNALYALALVTWAVWGIVFGTNRGNNIQPSNPLKLPIPPPIVLQELSKTFVGNLTPSTTASGVSTVYNIFSSIFNTVIRIVGLR